MSRIKLNWKQIEPSPHGCRQWQTVDGMFRLTCADRYDDIPMIKEWILWQWKSGTWFRAYEGRSKAQAEKEAKRRYLTWESEDE